MLFVDAGRAGRNDAAALAKALEIDAYKAKLLLAARVPFLAQGFPSLGYALKAAETLAGLGFPASAHSAEDVARVPAGVAAGAVTRKGDVWSFATASGVRDVPCEALRALVHGKLTAKPDAPADPGFGLDAAVLGRGRRGAPEPRAPIQYWRLDLFGEPRTGECVRLSIRHDLFDYSSLAERKTLSSVRNLAALREELARSRTKQGDVPVDEAFDKTDLARVSFLPDSHSELDVVTGAARTIAVQSNRAAFEQFAALRFLHERTRIPEKADHYFEL